MVAPPRIMKHGRILVGAAQAGPARLKPAATKPQGDAMIRHWLPIFLLAACVTPSLAPLPAAAQALPNLALSRVRYSTVKATVRPEGELKAQVDAIDTALAEASRFGRSGEVRRLLAKGLTLLSGRPWTEAAEFASSLVLRTERVFVDPAKPYTVRVEQIYSPAFALTSSLTAHARLRQPPAAALPARAARFGTVVKDFGTFKGVPRDLLESPFPMDLDLAGVPDGRHSLEVEVLNGNQPLGTARLSIEVSKRLDARLEKLAAGGARVAPDLEPEVLYPVDFIRKVNRGRAELAGFEIEKELLAAEATLAAATSGKDPFAGRTGDMERHYVLADAGEIMPYRLCVPTSYTRKRAWPLVVALHGLGATEDSFFDAYGRRVPALAEERGYLVVAPLGYRVDGGYGAMGRLATQDSAEQRKRELSEADVLNVIDLVRKQYRVDEDRIYLLGHSMGAIGTWYLAAKYPGRWAALAPFSGFGTPASVGRMERIPQFVVHGDADATVPVASSRAMVAEMKRLGVEHQYIEVPGGNHLNVVEPNLRGAFDFFDKHRRQ
jgi:poly(3-hydroxybutyrate) depolymerase